MFFKDIHVYVTDNTKIVSIINLFVPRLKLIKYKE